LYENETVYLKEVPGYAQSIDWNELFSDYHFNDGRELGKIKSIVTAPDGSVFMSHKTTYAIWKFDRNGKLVKKFGEKGTGRGQFVMRARVGGILGEKYLYTYDVQGRILFFDLEGNYIKKLKLDYMPLRTLPLSQMKIAIFGHVPMGGGKVKNVVSLLDFDTGKENIIWEGSYNPMLTEINLDNGKSMFARLNISYPPVTRFGIASTKSGNLLIASNEGQKIMEYSPKGKLIRSLAVDIEPVRITDEDINRMYDLQMKSFDRFQDKIMEKRKLTPEELDQIKKKYKEQLEGNREKIKAGDPLPFYSTIFTDPEDNILVFEFTREKKSNQFSVFALNRNGALIGVSKFLSENYDLTFTGEKFVFQDGFIYAVASKTNVDGIPLRLVKFTPSD
jgi:hypothetical protein